ncbi:MAG: preprotein translocase subunit SecE [Actinomycetota bacterium]|nr:preprotein translocase subunit SecE [Actinomycetota bacterium]
MATEASAESRGSRDSGSSGSSGRAGRRRAQGGNPVSRLFQSLGLFVSQILDELRKVVRPTGKELLNYTVVVIVFVLVIMGIVAALDFVFHRLVLLALAG